MPGFEVEDSAEDELKLFQGSLGMAGPGVPTEGIAAVPKYELPLPAAAAPTVLLANLGVPRGEFWNAQTVGLDSVRGVPMGERGLKSGSLTDKEGVAGLNSEAEAFGLNSEAPALSMRGEPKGEEGADEPAILLFLLPREAKPLCAAACSKTCANGSLVLCANTEGDCGLRGEGDMGRVGVAIPERRRAGLPAVLLEGVRVRLNDDERDSDPEARGMGAGELKDVWPVGCASSRYLCMRARTTASKSSEALTQ